MQKIYPIPAFATIFTSRPTPAAVEFFSAGLEPKASTPAEMSQSMAFVSPRTVIFIFSAFLTVLTLELTTFSRQCCFNVHD